MKIMSPKQLNLMTVVKDMEWLTLSKTPLVEVHLSEPHYWRYLLKINNSSSEHISSRNKCPCLPRVMFQYSEQLNVLGAKCLGWSHFRTNTFCGELIHCTTTVLILFKGCAPWPNYLTPGTLRNKRSLRGSASSTSLHWNWASRTVNPQWLRSNHTWAMITALQWIKN